MNPILLDTHAALWAVGGTLRSEVMKEVDLAAERDELLLSPITAWEIGILVQRRRLALTATLQDYVRALFNRSGVMLAALTPAIAAAATQLPGRFRADPADRFLIATAAAYGARLVTRDRQIHEYAKLTSYLRCIAC